jgi:FkbM family methyltransferase
MSVTAKYCKEAYPIPNGLSTRLAIDVGANIGGFSMAYYESFDEIIYFEANPETFKLTESNTKYLKNVKGYNLAVSDEDDKILTLMNHLNKDNGSVTCSPSITESGHNDWNEVIGEVKTISLESVFEMVDNRTINFLKLDCENSEYEFLINKDLSNIEHISMELHWQMGKDKYDELLRYLSIFFTIRGNTNFINGANTMVYFDKIKYEI